MRGTSCAFSSAASTAWRSSRQASDGLQALDDISRLNPDVAFLDVQMPGLTGFEVARRLLENGTDLAVVFVTAFDHRAVEAFEVNAVDYVLKPIEPARLEQAVGKVRKRRSEQPLGDQLERLVRLMAGQKDRRNQVAVKVADRIVLVQADDIIYASLAEDSISIVTGQVSGTSNYRTLDELQARLDPDVFWRVHRSHLVNINKIKEIVPWFSRNYILRMRDGKATEIPVSRSQTRRLREYLKLLATPGIEAVLFRPNQPPGKWHFPGSKPTVSRGSIRRHLRPATGDSRLVGDRRSPCRANSTTSPVVRRLELWRDEFVAWVKTLASAAVYATLIVTFGFQVARVEGQSMAPTLADQDRLIVNKLAYRLGNPQRGDIVMLYYPINPDKSFVKRVIAEESDTVRIVDGRVYVNDVPLRDDYVPPEYRSHDDWGPSVIPEGYYFVMGDHRNNSSDSRHWGFVPKKYIIGKVQLRWWPVPNGRVFSEYLTLPAICPSATDRRSLTPCAPPRSGVPFRHSRSVLRHQNGH